MLRASIVCFAVALIALAILISGCAPTIRVDGRDVPYNKYKLVLEHKYGVAQEVKHEKD